MIKNTIQPSRMIKLCLTVSLIFTMASPAYAQWGRLMERGQEILEQQTGTSDQKESTQEAPAQLPEGVNDRQLAMGLKEALSVGAERAIDTLSQTNGYMGDSRVRIQPPGMVAGAVSTLKRFGFESQVEAFELSMNRAAEQAIAQATPVVVGAIESMTLEDAQRIYQGGDTAATDYFKSRTFDDLSRLMRPQIEASMAQTGTTAAWQSLTSAATSSVPVLEGYTPDLADHVTESALNGLFLLLAEEEQKIRRDPLARSTDLLKQVFGL